MLDIVFDDSGNVSLSGRFDASQAEKAERAFASVTSSCVIDLKNLDYISSAGLGVLLATFKRLDDSGHTLALRNMNDYIRRIFQVSGLDRIFRIE